MIVELDTIPTAPYVELTDRIILRALTQAGHFRRRSARCMHFLVMT